MFISELKISDKELMPLLLDSYSNIKLNLMFLLTKQKLD